MIQKINPKIPPIETCQRSIEWLENYAKIWFAKNIPKHGLIWFPDNSSKLIGNNFPPSESSVEIVLTGSFFLRLLESKFWTFKHFRLWTFSTRIRTFISNTFQIPVENIGIISRSTENIGHCQSIKNDELNLVYAGRLSLTKNIEALLQLTSKLQTSYQVKVTLDIFGESDDFIDASIGRYTSFPLDQIYQSIVEKLPWIEKPVFHGFISDHKWHEVKRTNPVFISLSTSMYEDFGTAAEIAIQNGWPCILSNWGGHSDVSGAFFVPAYLIAHTTDPLCVQVLKSNILAKKFFDREFTKNKITTSSFTPKNYLDSSLLHALVDNFVKKWGPSILLCFRDEMNSFADTPKGIEFFKNYHEAFGRNQGKEAIIINDLRPLNTGVIIPSPESEFDIVYLRELFNVFYLKRLHSYTKLTLIELGDDQEYVINFLKKILGDSSPIFIFDGISSNKIK